MSAIVCQGQMRYIGIGHIKNTGMVFRLYLKELVQHVCIVGRSGAGKTNTIRLLQTELHRLGIPFRAFDLAKVGTRYPLDLLQGRAERIQKNACGLQSHDSFSKLKEAEKIVGINGQSSVIKTQSKPVVTI